MVYYLYNKEGGFFLTMRYRILRHIPGRIRIEVPAMRQVSLKALQQLSAIPLPCGIEGIRPNPLTGTLLIKYDPRQIDIVAYIEDMASHEEIACILKKGGSDERY